MTHLHHIFQEILKDLQPINPELENYKYLLISHDRHYQYADDYRVYCRGREEFDRLLTLQRKLDPAREIWNTIFKDQDI